MALNIAHIPKQIISDLQERGHSLEAIADMDPQKAFREYCEWNGLIRWGDALWDAMENLNRAEKK